MSLSGTKSDLENGLKNTIDRLSASENLINNLKADISQYKHENLELIGSFDLTNQQLGACKDELNIKVEELRTIHQEKHILVSNSAELSEEYERLLVKHTELRKEYEINDEFYKKVKDENTKLNELLCEFKSENNRYIFLINFF